MEIDELLLAQQLLIYCFECQSEEHKTEECKVNPRRFTGPKDQRDLKYEMEVITIRASPEPESGNENQDMLKNCSTTVEKSSSIHATDEVTHNESQILSECIETKVQDLSDCETEIQNKKSQRKDENELKHQNDVEPSASMGSKFKHTRRNKGKRKVIRELKMELIELQIESAMRIYPQYSTEEASEEQNINKNITANISEREDLALKLERLKTKENGRAKDDLENKSEDFLSSLQEFANLREKSSLPTSKDSVGGMEEESIHFKRFQAKLETVCLAVIENIKLQKLDGAKLKSVADISKDLKFNTSIWERNFIDLFHKWIYTYGYLECRIPHFWTHSWQFHTLIPFLKIMHLTIREKSLNPMYNPDKLWCETQWQSDICRMILSKIKWLRLALEIDRRNFGEYLLKFCEKVRRHYEDFVPNNGASPKLFEFDSSKELSVFQRDFINKLVTWIRDGRKSKFKRLNMWKRCPEFSPLVPFLSTLHKTIQDAFDEIPVSSVKGSNEYSKWETWQKEVLEKIYDIAKVHSHKTTNNLKRKNDFNEDLSEGEIPDSEDISGKDTRKKHRIEEKTSAINKENHKLETIRLGSINLASSTKSAENSTRENNKFDENLSDGEIPDSEDINVKNEMELGMKENITAKYAENSELELSSPVKSRETEHHYSSEIEDSQALASKPIPKLIRNNKVYQEVNIAKSTDNPSFKRKKPTKITLENLPKKQVKVVKYSSNSQATKIPFKSKIQDEGLKIILHHTGIDNLVKQQPSEILKDFAKLSIFQQDFLTKLDEWLDSRGQCEFELNPMWNDCSEHKSLIPFMHYVYKCIKNTWNNKILPSKESKKFEGWQNHFMKILIPRINNHKCIVQEDKNEIVKELQNLRYIGQKYLKNYLQERRENVSVFLFTNTLRYLYGHKRTFMEKFCEWLKCEGKCEFELNEMLERSTKWKSMVPLLKMVHKTIYREFNGKHDALEFVNDILHFEAWEKDFLKMIVKEISEFNTTILEDQKPRSPEPS